MKDGNYKQFSEVFAEKVFDLANLVFILFQGPLFLSDLPLWLRAGSSFFGFVLWFLLVLGSKKALSGRR